MNIESTYIFYYLILIQTAIIGFIGHYFDNKRLKKLLLTGVLLFILMLIASIRSNSVGTDLISYIPFYKDTCLKTFSECVTLNGYRLYTTYNKIIGLLFFENVRSFLVISSFVILLPITIWFYRSSNCIWLSYWLYIAMGLYLRSFSMLRQAIAISIVCLSYKYIINKSLIKYLLIIATATLFHSTAICCIPLYYLYRIKMNTKIIVACIIASLILVYAAPKLMPSVTILYQNKYVVTDDSGGGGKLGYIMHLGFILFGLYYINHSKYPITNYTKLAYINILCVLFVQPFCMCLDILGRLLLYYQISACVLLPNLLTTVKNKYIRYFILIIILFLSAFIFYKRIASNLGGVVPYDFYLW